MPEDGNGGAEGGNPAAGARSGRAARATLDDNFRRAVLAFLKRSGLSGCQLGELTLGNAGFVATLGRGRSQTLATADRVLSFMGEAPIGPMFRREVEAFVAVTGAGHSHLGLKATGDPGFVDKLRNGAPIRLSTVERVRGWMRDAAGAGERAAIARTLAGSAEAAPDLARDPAALGALAEAPAPEERRDEPGFLTTRQAAAFLTLSPRTLDRYRATGKGPAFHKLETRIVYARADLEQWAKARRRECPVSRG